MKYFLSFALFSVLGLGANSSALAAFTCTDYLRELGGPEIKWTGRPSWQIENLEEEFNNLKELSQALGNFQDGEEVEIGVYTAETYTPQAATEKKKTLIRKFVENGIYLSPRLPFFDGLEQDFEGPNGPITFSQRSYRYGIWLIIRSREEALVLQKFLHSPDQELLQYSFTFPHPKSFSPGEHIKIRDLMEKTNFPAGKKLQLIFVPVPSERENLLSEIKSFGVLFSPVEKEYSLNLKTFSDGIKLTVENLVQLNKVEQFLSQEVARSRVESPSEPASLQSVVFPETLRR